jgi:hypothetical protein
MEAKTYLLSLSTCYSFNDVHFYCFSVVLYVRNKSGRCIHELKQKICMYYLKYCTFLKILETLTRSPCKVKFIT